ncbi:MAG: hypothetical protein HY650_16740 [Acidobacteria bacterium]|nr:hypothetical protein [Acidobacteriota bacterium]
MNTLKQPSSVLSVLTLAGSLMLAGWLSGSEGVRLAAYTDGGSHDHPSPTGNKQVTGEFVPLLKIFYNRWKTGDSSTLLSASEPLLPRDFALPTPLFAPGSAWNQSATEASVLLQSGQQILVTYRVLRGDTSYSPFPAYSVPNWPFAFLNYDEYTIPVFRAGQGEQSVLIRDYDGNLGWTNPKIPISQVGGPVSVSTADGMVRPAGPERTDSDGHLVLYNPVTFLAYDFWQATTALDTAGRSLGGGQTGSRIHESGMIDFFDIRGPGVNPTTYSSARATGTPLLAGLILPEDIEKGEIAHALCFAIPGMRNLSRDPSTPLPSDYFYPASTTQVSFYNTNTFALAAGQRLRLKAKLVDAEGHSIDEGQLSPITHTFLKALRDYGAYLVDGSGAFSFYAEDIHTAVLHLTEAEVNTLIGQPIGTPLGPGRTKWHAVVEKLNEELGQIPIAYGPWQDGQDPARATITASNFEVVEPAKH